MLQENKVTFAQKMALGAFLLLCGVAAAAVAGFLIGVPVGPYTFYIAAAALFIYCLWRDRTLGAALLLDIVLLVLWALLAWVIFDWSFDGMYYHKQAIITLKEGWVPLYTSSLNADVFAGYPDMALWLDNYPKGIWIFSAVIYSITNLLETAKAVNILFLIAVAGQGFHLCRRVLGFPGAKSAMGAALLVLNPVFVCQVFTSYNDLAVGACIIITALLGIEIYHEKITGTGWALLFCVAAFSCTVKFTAPVFVGLVLLAVGVCYGVKKRKTPKALIKPVVIVLLAFVFGVCALGCDPYLKHAAAGQHIIYPVMGEGAYDIMNTNPPKTFEEKNGLLRLFDSLFSKTNNDVTAAPQLKVPFSVYQDEWIHLSNADIRIGGFGVLFSGILVFGAAVLALLLAKKSKMLAGVKIILVLFLALTLFFPESWWARYASYTYYLPVLILLSAMGDTGKIPRWVWWPGWLLVVANSAVLLVAVVQNGFIQGGIVNDKLAEIKAENKPVIVRVNDFPSHVKLFSEYCIDFEVQHYELSDAQIFYRSTKYQFQEK